MTYNITDLQEIGRGAYGIVYKCKDSKGNTLVNKELKVKDVEAIKRFKREVELTSRLKHKNIVKILGKNLDGDRPFYIMELYDGNLRKTIEERSVIGDHDKILKITYDILSALSYAHEQGVAHRDLKPENILFDCNNNYYLCDFGIGKDCASSTSTALTIAGSSLGTNNYMAPEQFANAKTSDQRSDVFAFGKLFIELFTGEIVPGLMDVDDIPDEFKEIISKCVKRKPEERYQSAGDVMVAFDLIGKTVGQKSTKDKIQEIISENVFIEFLIEADYRKIAYLLRSCDGPSEFHECAIILTDCDWSALSNVEGAEILKDILKFMKSTSSENWPFAYTDKLGKCYYNIGKYVKEPEILSQTIVSLFDLAKVHNRYFVYGLWAKMCKLILDDEAVENYLIANVDKGSWSDGSEYIDRAKVSKNLFKSLIDDA